MQTIKQIQTDFYGNDSEFFQVLNNELLIHKIATFLTNIRDLISFKNVNHMTKREVPKIYSLKKRELILKWKFKTNKGFDEFETMYRCKTAKKLEKLNLPFVPFIGKNSQLSISLNRNDNEEYNKALVMGLYNSIKKPHNLKKINISRWWDNHDYDKLHPLFDKMEMDGRLMNMEQVIDCFKTHNVELIHSWGNGGYNGFSMPLKMYQYHIDTSFK